MKTNIIRRPILPALLFQLISSPPTSSFGLSTRRFWTPLRAAGKTYENDPDGSDGNDGNGANQFERAVRSVTGNKDYKFGDISRSVVDSTTHGVEDAVRAVTHDENYHFGDYTKKAISSTTGGFEGVVKSVTGNEDYRFGDLTRATVGTATGVITYSEKTLSLMRDRNIHELIELMSVFWNSSMNEEERNEAFTVAVYSGAILILAYNFVSNFMSGLVFAAAWAKVSMAAGASPWSPDLWGTLLMTKSSLDLFFGAPCIPARAIITIPWFFVYRRIVISATSKFPMREKYPTINRYLFLILSWLMGNVALVGGLTFVMVKMVSLWTGVPLSP